MNEEEIKAAKVGMTPQEGETTPAHGESGARPRERCPANCKLYRWYPPLLVLSTVMAGVFCLLYVTKPVFLEAPNQNQPDPHNVSVFAEQIAHTDPASTGDSEKALMPVHLDPDISGGRQEPADREGDSAGLPSVAELKPMQVQKPTKSLFQPMDPEDMPDAIPSKVIAVESASSETIPEASPRGSEADQAIAKTEPVDEAPKDEPSIPVEEAVAMASPEELEAVQEELAEGPVGHPTDDPGDEFEGDVLMADADKESDSPDRATDRFVMRASVLGEFYSNAGTDQTSAGRPLGSTKTIALKEEP